MKIIKYGGMAALLVVVLVTSYFLYCLYLVHSTFSDGGLFRCSDTMLSESSSPSGEYVATLFNGSCGATTPLVTSVNLRRNIEMYMPDKDGFFTSGRVFSSRGKVEIKLSWIDDINLIVEYCPAEIITKEIEWGSVSISYKFLNCTPVNMN